MSSTNVSASTVILGGGIALASYLAFQLLAPHPAAFRRVQNIPFWKLVAPLFWGATVEENYELLLREPLERDGIVRFYIGGKWVFVTNDPKLVKQVTLNTDDYPKEDMADIFPNSMTARFFGTNVVFANGDVWKRQRRVANPAFRSISSKVFGECGLKALKVLEEVDNEPIEVKDFMHRFTLDALGLISFGFDFNNIGNPNGPYVELYRRVMDEVNKPLYVVFPFLEYTPFTRRPQAWKQVDEFDALLTGIVDKKRADIAQNGVDDEHADLLTLMLKSENSANGKGLSDQELRDNLAIFFLAGHDTTANSLTTILYTLAKRKDIQDKAREEVLAVLGDDPTPSLEQQKQLTYLTTVIFENLRLYPPVHALLQRAIAKETVYKDHVLPVGTAIAINAWGVHRSPKNWERPDEFIPERFADPSRAAEHQSSCRFVGFGFGTRMCLGINFSLIEQRVLLSLLLRKYEFSLPENSPHEERVQYSAGSGGTLNCAPMPIWFKRRM